MSAPPSSQTVVTRSTLIVTLIGLCCSTLLAALDQTVVGTASLKIVQDIGGAEGVRYLPWMTTAYLLLSTSTNPLYGKVSDLYGRKPAYFFALTTFLIGSAFAGMSANLGELIAARAIQGLGAGGLTISFIAIVGDLVPPRERSRYMSLFVLIYGSCSVIGPLVGGFLAQPHSFLGLSTTWRWAFYVNMPFGALAMVLVGLAFKVAHQRREHRVDSSARPCSSVGWARVCSPSPGAARNTHGPPPRCCPWSPPPWCCCRRFSGRSPAPRNRLCRCGCFATAPSAWAPCSSFSAPMACSSARSCT